MNFQLIYKESKAYIILIFFCC